MNRAQTDGDVLTRPADNPDEQLDDHATLPPEKPREALRFPLEPLVARMGIVLLADGEEGGQQNGQPLESVALIAERLGVSKRTVRRWLRGLDWVAWSGSSNPSGSSRGVHRGGLSWAQADRYAIAAGFMPWQVWPDWEMAGPGEEDLFDHPCRCRLADRVPVAGECDRCGGHLPSSSAAAS